MIKSRKNKVGFFLSLVLIVLAITLHVLYSLRLSTFHFSSNRLHQHLYAALEASRNDDDLTAEMHYKAALREAEKKSPENEHVALALQRLGVQYVVLKRYDDAETTFQRAVSVTEKVYGPESQELQHALTLLSTVRLLRMKAKELRDTIQETLSVVEQGIDKNDAAAAERLRSIREDLRKTDAKHR